MFQKLLLMSAFLVILLFTENYTVECSKPKTEDLPIFLEPVANLTVSLGREATLSCSIDNLGKHKVAWVHLDREMIVAIHRQIVSREQRFFVTHDSHKTWTLHVTEVTEKDRGFYMCQVNTDPMISQKGYLQVVVPPNIIDENSSGSNFIAREKDNVTLGCKAEGFPKPKIRWKREDGKAIVNNNKNKNLQVEGNILTLTTVSREHNGAYLCIASNGVPPSVSKRITLKVEFPPQLHVPNQLVGVPLHNEIQLECQIEASPKPVTYWTLDGLMISNSTRVIAETISDSYRYSMFIKIFDVRESDYGQYLCVAKNSIAETNGSIKLNKVSAPTNPSSTFREKISDRKGTFDQSKTARHRSGEKSIFNSKEELANQESIGHNDYHKISFENYYDGDREGLENTFMPQNPFTNTAGTETFRTKLHTQLIPSSILIFVTNLLTHYEC